MVFYVSIGIKREKCTYRNNDSSHNYVHIRLDMSSLKAKKTHGFKSSIVINVYPLDILSI